MKLLLLPHSKIALMWRREGGAISCHDISYFRPRKCNRPFLSLIHFHMTKALSLMCVCALIISPTSSSSSSVLMCVLAFVTVLFTQQLSWQPPRPSLSCVSLYLSLSFSHSMSAHCCNAWSTKEEKKSQLNHWLCVCVRLIKGGGRTHMKICQFLFWHTNLLLIEQIGSVMTPLRDHPHLYVSGSIMDPVWDKREGWERMKPFSSRSHTHTHAFANQQQQHFLSLSPPLFLSHWERVSIFLSLSLSECV